MKGISLKLCSAAILATMLAAPSAYAACKQGYCMTGSWDGSARRVDFTTSLRGTHFNVNNGQQQIELGRNVRSFVVYPTSSKPLQFRYAIQTCNKGGPFSKSSCSPWVNFTHTEK